MNTETTIDTGNAAELRPMVTNNSLEYVERFGYSLMDDDTRRAYQLIWRLSAARFSNVLQWLDYAHSDRVSAIAAVWGWRLIADDLGDYTACERIAE